MRIESTLSTGSDLKIKQLLKKKKKQKQFFTLEYSKVFLYDSQGFNRWTLETLIC